MSRFDKTGRKKRTPDAQTGRPAYKPSEGEINRRD
jgi:hypothetical protein